MTPNPLLLLPLSHTLFLYTSVHRYEFLLGLYLDRSYRRRRSERIMVESKGTQKARRPASRDISRRWIPPSLA